MVRASSGLIGSTYTYDASGNLTSRTNTLGHTTHFEYDETGNQTAITDALGKREEFSFDFDGNLVGQVRPDGSELSFEYDALGRLTQRSDEASRTNATFTFDAGGNRKGMTDITGESSFEYDEAGRMVRATSPDGSSVRYVYDVFSNITSIIYPDGTSVDYEYDEGNRLIRVRDRYEQVTTYSYDALNRPVRMVRPEEIVTTITYDKRSNLTRITNRDDQGIISDFEYDFDKSGRIIRERATQANVTVTSTFSYDVQAQLETIHSRSGTHTSYARFAYDKSGNRTRAVIEESGQDKRVIDYSYNEVSELTLKTDSHTGTARFTYDAQGNQVARSFSPSNEHTDPTLTTYSFDALGRLEAVSKEGTLLLAALYDGDDNRVFSASRNPDPLDETQETRATNLFFAALHEDLSSETTTPTASLPLIDTPHNLDPKAKHAERDLFLYGVMQGLSNLSHLSAYLTVRINQLWTLEIEEKRQEFAQTNQRASHTQTLTDLIYIPDAPAHENTLTDLLDSPNVTNPNHEKDYTITRYINDTNRDYPRVLVEYDEQGSPRHTFTHDTGILGVNGALGMSSDNSFEHFLTDGRGSVTETLSHNNVTTYRYDAFGNTNKQGTSTNPLTYNQERFDTSASLQFLRARYVDLNLSRFISRDSVLGTSEDPRTHNLYTYVANDPLNWLDPSGHTAVPGRFGAPSRSVSVATGAAVRIPYAMVGRTAVNYRVLLTQRQGISSNNTARRIQEQTTRINRGETGSDAQTRRAQTMLGDGRPGSNQTNLRSRIIQARDRDHARDCREIPLGQGHHVQTPQVLPVRVWERTSHREYSLMTEWRTFQAVNKGVIEGTTIWHLHQSRHRFKYAREVARHTGHSGSRLVRIAIQYQTRMVMRGLQGGVETFSFPHPVRTSAWRNL